MMDWFQPKRPQTLLGLSFDGLRVEAVVAHRSNGSAELLRSGDGTFTSDPRTADPEVVGRELRALLDAAGIRERRCAVALQEDLALTLQTVVPELSEEDVRSLLQLEAENGFPYPADSLASVTSRFQVAGGPAYATQLAVQVDTITRLEAVLRAARLLPVSFTFGITALQIPSGTGTKAGGVIALWIGDRKVSLLISSGAGVVTLRTLEPGLLADEESIISAADHLVRELRVTLGQLPEAVRDSLKTLRIFGKLPGADLLASALELRAAGLGLKLERVHQFAPNELGVKLLNTAPVTPAVAVVVRQLADQTAKLEFLPPRVSAWQQFAGKHSSGKLVMAGKLAAAVLGIGAVAFLWQQIQLTRLSSSWARMAPKVRELDHFQQQTKRFRPWFDDSIRSLSILRRLTEALPENGDVTAKTIELRETGTVICTGTAIDKTALLKALDRLRAMSEVVDVQVDQVLGKAAIQFTFNFQWSGSLNTR